MLLTENLLVYVLLSPIIGILLLLLIPSREKQLLKFIALNASCFSFIGSLILWGSFSKSVGFFQFLVKSTWFPLLTLNFTLGVDGISLFFIINSPEDEKRPNSRRHPARLEKNGDPCSLRRTPYLRGRERVEWVRRSLGSFRGC